MCMSVVGDVSNEICFVGATMTTVEAREVCFSGVKVHRMLKEIVGAHAAEQTVETTNKEIGVFDRLFQF